MIIIGYRKNEIKSSATVNPPTSTPDATYNIDSDTSDYNVTDDDDNDEEIERDEDLVLMTEEEKVETKYLAIFENNCEEFDEQVISVENADALKKSEMSMKDRTDKGYYRCKVKHQSLYNDFRRALARYITADMLAMLQHDYSTQKTNL